MAVKPFVDSASVIEPATGVPSTWAGIGSPIRARDGGRHVDQIGLEVVAGGRGPCAGEGDDSFGPVSAGEVGVGLDPVRHPRSASCGPSKAHRVERSGRDIPRGVGSILIGLGGGDDLRKEQGSALGMPGIGGAALRGGRAGLIDLPRRHPGGCGFDSAKGGAQFT